MTLTEEAVIPATAGEVPQWALKVAGLGRVYGAGGAAAVAGTGPEHDTVISPSTGAVVAAWDVSFEVAPGEALGVVGESGSGKSTVVRCIAGDDTATAGSVYLRGYGDGAVSILDLSPSVRRKLRVDQVSVVYQDPAAGLDLGVTAGGNVAEPLTASGWRHYGKIRARAAELLRRTEVPEARMDHLVRTFSGGMR